MRQFDRAFRLYQVIRAHRYPVAMRVLCERLECSQSTAKRAIRDLRTLGAPLEYDRKLRGYFFDERDGQPYELPGLWFNSRELTGLLVMLGVLRELNSDLLESQLAPLRSRIEELLAAGSRGSEEFQRRVRVPAIAARPVESNIFRAASSALLSRRRLRVTYPGGSGEGLLRRTLSPQRLVYYRNNWYLDAWCHLRRALRSFSLERVEDPRILEVAARDMDEEWLDRELGSSYGIYAGEPKAWARIRFSASVAKQVAAEQWHPRQRGLMRGGEYELEIPYSHSTELLMDVLRYGPDAEVLSPPDLRKLARRLLEEAGKKYS